jgi:hypothetical protein
MGQGTAPADEDGKPIRALSEAGLFAEDVARIIAEEGLRESVRAKARAARARKVLLLVFVFIPLGVLLLFVILIAIGSAMKPL